MNLLHKVTNSFFWVFNKSSLLHFSAELSAYWKNAHLRNLKNFVNVDKSIMKPCSNKPIIPFFWHALLAPVREKGVSILDFSQNQNASPPFLRAKRAKKRNNKNVLYAPFFYRKCLSRDKIFIIYHSSLSHRIAPNGGVHVEREK
jgi:hypothetical protein